MQKPDNYDSIKTSSGYTPVAVGGHYLTILKVTETKSKAGNDMVTVAFDMAKNDSQAGYFKNEYDNDTREGKKWPYGGRVNIMTYYGNGFNARLKAFLTSVENSNPGFKVVWGEQAGADWGAQFRGKKVGGVFGKVENEYNGKVSERTELRWFCAVSEVPTAKVPDLKPLRKKDTMTTADGFIGIPVGTDDADLPFL